MWCGPRTRWLRRASGERGPPGGPFLGVSAAGAWWGRAWGPLYLFGVSIPPTPGHTGPRWLPGLPGATQPQGLRPPRPSRALKLSQASPPCEGEMQAAACVSPAPHPGRLTLRVLLEQAVLGGGGGLRPAG